MRAVNREKSSSHCNRADFLEAILTFWEEHQTRDVIRQMERAELPAKEKFHRLVFLSFSEANKLQSAILAWANQDEHVAKRVVCIEQRRIP